MLRRVQHPRQAPEGCATSLYRRATPSTSRKPFAACPSTTISALTALPAPFGDHLRRRVRAPRCVTCGTTPATKIPARTRRYDHSRDSRDRSAAYTVAACLA